MPIDKIIIKDNGEEKEIIDFTDRIYDNLSNGYHTITIEGHYQGNKVSSTSKNILVSSGAYEPEYQAVLDYAVANGISTPSIEQQQMDNALLVSYKATGGWDKDDVVFKFSGSAPSSFRLICWKRLVQAIPYGTVGWNSLGAKGNGFNSYIDTLYNPQTDGTLFTRNNASIMLSVAAMSTTGFAFGNESIRLSNNYIRLNDISSFSNVNVDTGLNQIVRTGASAKRFKNKNGEQTYSHPSDEVEDSNLYILGTNQGGEGVNLSDVNIGFFTAGAPKIEEHAAIQELLSVANG